MTESFLISGRTVNVSSGELEGPEGTIGRVEPMAMRVLVHLARNQGEVVSRSELLDTVWQGRYVTEDVLTGAISALRKALGDSARNPRFIQTVAGEGYRLLAEVVASPPTSPPAASRIKRRWMAAGLVGLVIVVTSWLLLTRPHRTRSENERAPSAPSPVTLAVLPFDNLTDDESLDYLAAGMTDQLITDLARHNGLRVISRTSVLRFAGTEEPMTEVAQALGAQVIVEGSILPLGGQVRVSAQLIDGKTDEHLWAEDYLRGTDDVFALLAELSAKIELKITGTIGPHPLPDPGRLIAEARDAFLKGRFLLNQLDPSKLEAATRLIERTLELEPEFAPAHLALATARFHAIEIGGDPQTGFAAMRASAHRARELQPDLPGIETYLALFAFGFEGNTEQAAQLFARSIEKNPSDVEARRWYASFLLATERPAEAVQQLRAAQLLDPESYPDANVARLLYAAGETDAALSELEVALELEPESMLAHQVAMQIFEAEGHIETAIQHARKTLSGSGYEAAGNAKLDQGLAAFHRWRYQTALDGIRDGQPLGETQLAALAAAAGEIAQALDLLERAADQGDIAVLYVNLWPQFKAMREEARFQSLRDRPRRP